MTTFARTIFPVLIVALLSAAVPAQQLPSGAAVVESRPGEVTIAQKTELSARVVAINKATRTVTLKGATGNTLDVVCGDEVRNFDQIKVGDLVVARYVESTILELKKNKTGAPAATEREVVLRAKPGEAPAGALSHQVVIMADVVGVDPTKKTISLRGPEGDVVVLPVYNPDQFKVVKVGDQVEVTYTQALGISVQPASAPNK